MDIGSRQDFQVQCPQTVYRKIEFLGEMCLKGQVLVFGDSAPNTCEDFQLVVLECLDLPSRGQLRVGHDRLEHEVEQPVSGQVLARDVVFGILPDTAGNPVPLLIHQFVQYRG